MKNANKKLGIFTVEAKERGQQRNQETADHADGETGGMGGK